MKKVFCLVDCNNFFASCEQIFNPKLQGKPIAVLSNNDGCIVARSDEVKRLGIPMGAPFFEWKDKIDQYAIHTCSANFQLYGDISNRVKQVLRSFTKNIETYSIDEAFLTFESISETELNKLAREIRDKVYKFTGVQVSVGIAPTKTLAKVANEHNKILNKYFSRLEVKTKRKYHRPNKNVCVAIAEREIDLILKNFPVGSIWGIGRKFTELLNRNGVYTAAEFKKLDDRFVRKQMSVVGQRTLMEINGISCVELDTSPEAKKMIISSRSFGKPVYTLEELRESVACYVGRAAQKLRKQGSVCSYISVYIRTGKHNKNSPYYASQDKILPIPIDYTPDLTKHAFDCLNQIYRSGYRYKKALITLGRIVPKDSKQMNFFYTETEIEKKSRVMMVMDKINTSYEQEKIQIAAMGTKKPWRGRRELMSPRYTTHWKEIPVVRC